MSTALLAQQRTFAAALRSTEGKIPDGMFRSTPQGGAPRFHIYHHAYRIRLEAALRENYPILFRMLGDDAFSQLAQDFLAAHPSSHPSIRWFGAALADFVAAHPEVLPHRALLDLIRMEWALSTAFDAADTEALAVQDLVAVAPADWPALRFVAHPCVHLLAMEWNIEPLWAALNADENANTDAPTAAPHHLLVWRRDRQTQWRSVHPPEIAILAACLAGEDFATLCEIAEQHAGEQAAATVAGYLRSWVENGLLRAKEHLHA